jgi:hypothetical protein
MSGQQAERDAAVKALAPHGWHVARETEKGYLVMRCSCGRHQETLHKTPNRSHFRQKVQKMIRDCSTGRGTK